MREEHSSALLTLDEELPIENLYTAQEAVQLEFEFNCPFIEAEYYKDGAQDIIQKLLPPDLLENSTRCGNAAQRSRFSDTLPLVRWSDLNRAPCALSVLLLCKFRQNACNFFYDMISRWLLPNHRVNVELFFASDVRLPHLSDDLLSVAEIVVHIKSQREVEEVRRNLHAIETEIRLGVVSNYHARRILEFKGLSTDGKTAMIQEKIGSLIQSHSKDFDRGIFSQMQHFLVTCREDFKKSRDYHHISRIISNIYSVQKVLKQNIAVFPERRHVMLKFLKTRLEVSTKRERPVLGILAGLNFLREHELFEKSHLVAAMQKHFPAIKAVEGSTIIDKDKESSLQTVYLEVEKEDGTDFSFDEVQTLRTALPDQLKENIEQLTHPIFMPRNEEEVLRNIMALSRQIRYVNDLPQVIISFDEQKGTDLCFTVIMLRIHAEQSPQVQELFANAKTDLRFLPDRVRRLGSIRRKYAKEAAVFRTLVSSKDFKRPDHSVDLYRARQHVLAELTRIVGEVRDFNGGMILKQQELLDSLKHSLGRTAEQHNILLEQFFYSLMPMEMRSIAEIDPLKQLFLMLLQATKADLRHRRKTGDWLFKQDSRRLFAILPDLSDAKKAVLQEKIDKLSLPNHKLISFSIDFQQNTYTGYLLFSEDASTQSLFLKTLEETV
ncbi:MAG: hypothetical protein JSS32_05320 [Verrucomicrobia bacterium]|nr:hypothetical protein [Verrucomicrobiota bacterium]